MNTNLIRAFFVVLTLPQGTPAFAKSSPQCTKAEYRKARDSVKEASDSPAFLAMLELISQCAGAKTDHNEWLWMSADAALYARDSREYETCEELCAATLGCSPYDLVREGLKRDNKIPKAQAALDKNLFDCFSDMYMDLGTLVPSSKDEPPTFSKQAAWGCTKKNEAKVPNVDDTTGRELPGRWVGDLNDDGFVDIVTGWGWNGSSIQLGCGGDTYVEMDLDPGDLGDSYTIEGVTKSAHTKIKNAKGGVENWRGLVLNTMAPFTDPNPPHLSGMVNKKFWLRFDPQKRVYRQLIPRSH